MLILFVYICRGNYGFPTCHARKNKSPGRGIFWEADVAGPGREPARCEAWETRAGIFSFTQEIQTNLNI